MSETDDTDELLIIPPDFFLTSPALDTLPDFGRYYSVVDSLISQVSHLENRINFIETSSELSVSLLGDSPDMDKKSHSAQNTPQKPRTKFTISSLPNSPVDRYKRNPLRGTTRKNEVNPMLGEIDNFISNVNKIKRLNAVRNLENDFTDLENQAKNLDLKQVDYMLKEMDLEEKKHDKKEKTWQTGDNINTVPDYNFGMRQTMYRGPQKTYTVENDLDTSSDSTQMTAFDRYKNAGNSEIYSNLGLVSLAKLWNPDCKENLTNFQQQLQEERLRRQERLRHRRASCSAQIKHCEQAIQELQNRVLELQERVAVAIQVDEAKDKAIMKIHETWEKTGTQVQNLEKEKEKLEAEIQRLKKQLNEGSVETNQKIAHYEKEASKAINQAKNAHEAVAIFEKKCMELENELKMSEINSGEFQKQYLTEVEKNRQYPEILAQKELELNDCKIVLAEARKEIAQSKKAVEICQTEISAMRENNDALQLKLNSEKEHLKKINEQKSKLLEEISAHKSISKGLQDELTKTREHLETNKLELKNFYQGQVELVVQNKLKEFQKQLDEAERVLKDDLSKKELAIAKHAASHIQQISEKHTLEIKLLEEKHQEESRLYQLQISQLRHELEESNLKIKRQHDKHVHIEKQLFRFMESLRQDHVTTLDEMNSFRSRSYTNLEEILSFNVPEEERERKGAEPDTPLTSRNERGAKKRENSLQETIQMLLDKKPQGEKGYEEQQATREGFYPRGKDGRGKPPWK